MRFCSTCGRRFSGEATFCPFDGNRLDGESSAEVLRASDEVLSGAIIGETYQVERLLGQGGMGVVYEVVHLKLGRRFALKLLKRELRVRYAET